jgi:hypothetical protein
MTEGGDSPAGREGLILSLLKDIANCYHNYKSHRTQINALAVEDGILGHHWE